MWTVDKRRSWPRRFANDNKHFVYCHNDLARHNVFLHPETLEVLAIIDWEYSGFFLPQTELPLWLQPYDQQEVDREEFERLRAVLLGPGGCRFRRGLCLCALNPQGRRRLPCVPSCFAWEAWYDLPMGPYVFPSCGLALALNDR